MLETKDIIKLDKYYRKKHKELLALQKKIEKEIEELVQRISNNVSSITHEETSELHDLVQYKEELDMKLDYLAQIIGILNNFPNKK